MDREPKIFIDTKQETGVHWPQNIQKALKKTRILLAVWSPHFFRSQWCVAEWESMLKREEVIGMSVGENAGGLIYPILFSDGKHFPEKAKERQYKDISRWGFPQKGFEETIEYIDFHRQVEDIAKELELQIEKVPAWQNDWPIIENPPIDEEPKVELMRI